MVLQCWPPLNCFIVHLSGAQFSKILKIFLKFVMRLRLEIFLR